jgi:hypothetical protein
VPSSYVLLSGQALSPWSTLPGCRRGVRHRCPGSGCPARLMSSPSGVQPLRCPVTRVGRPGSADPPRLLSRPRPALAVAGRVQPSAVHPIRPDASGSSTFGGGVGTKSRRPTTVTTATVEVLWRPQPRRLGRRPSSPGDGRRRRGSAAVSRGARSGPGPGGGGACPLRGQAGQAGVPSRLWLAVARWAGEQAPARAGRAGRVLPSRAGWATTVSGDCGGGPSGWPRARSAGGDGVRPQRGPGWQRAFPAGRRQRCDLREWVVGLPGLEPGTSSLSGIEG